MKPRIIRDGVYALGAIDWDRRLFDSLIPLPDGTSYNAYLIHGSEKAALLDSVDPSKLDVLMSQLEDVPGIDYVVSHHAEQDHSGTIPAILEKYGQAKVVSTARAKGMLVDLLAIPEERIVAIEDGETLSLGGKTLEFISTPWVHWPETMVSYLREDRILFSCDFFGSHLATTELYASESRILEPAKRYYAEIMMPFAGQVLKDVEKVEPLGAGIIAPSHGPLYDKPKLIVDAYREWAGGEPRNLVCLPFVTMHESTRLLVDHLTGALAARQGLDIATDALLDQCGVVRVNTVEELFDLALAFSKNPLPRGNRLGILTNAGGPAIMATDTAIAHGLSMANFSERTRHELRRLLPPEASI
ncbi:MAG: MBL fold metallo-hydrolase, partial [Dehalococcoidia bacterium]